MNGVPQGDPQTDPIEAFAALRQREIGPDADFGEWAGELGDELDYELPPAHPIVELFFSFLETIPVIDPDPLDDAWDFLDDLAAEANGGEDPEWPWADCPVGCRQLLCTHGPNQN